MSGGRNLNHEIRENHERGTKISTTDKDDEHSYGVGWIASHQCLSVCISGLIPFLIPKLKGGAARPNPSSKAMDCEENPNHKAHKGHRGLWWEEATFFVSFVICVAKSFLSSFGFLV